MMRKHEAPWWSALRLALLVLLVTGCGAPLASLSDDAVAPRSRMARLAEYRNALERWDQQLADVTDRDAVRRARTWLARLEKEPPDSKDAPLLDEAIRGAIQLLETSALRRERRVDGYATDENATEGVR